MTSFRQIEANRRNAQKRKARVRKRKTASNGDAQSAVERELVLRLAGVLWRLRRATTIETGLFDIQADQLSGLKQARQVQPVPREVVHGLFGPAHSIEYDRDPVPHRNGSVLALSSAAKSLKPADNPTAELARCFLRLANLPNYALDRLSRYEATLWRQARQIVFALDALDRRKPQERRHPFRIGRRQELSASKGDDDV